MVEMPLWLLEQVTGQTDLAAVIYDADRRASRRVPLSAPAALCRYRNGVCQPPGPVRLRDISTTGISLLYREKLAAGEPFLLRLTRKDERPLPVECATARCDAIDSRGLYVLAAAFTSIRVEGPPELPPEDLSPAARLPPALGPEDVPDPALVERIRRAILG